MCVEMMNNALNVSHNTQPMCTVGDARPWESSTGHSCFMLQGRPLHTLVVHPLRPTLLLRFHVSCRHKSPLHHNLVEGSKMQYPRLHSLGEVGGDDSGGPVLNRFFRMTVGVHWASSRSSVYIRVSERKLRLFSLRTVTVACIETLSLCSSSCCCTRAPTLFFDSEDRYAAALPGPCEMVTCVP
jgi:hypothetical protein